METVEIPGTNKNYIIIIIFNKYMPITLYRFYSRKNMKTELNPGGDDEKRGAFFEQLF